MSLSLVSSQISLTHWTWGALWRFFIFLKSLFN
jgi:hypothetical protein